MGVLAIVAGFICLMILQHLCNKQDVKSAYEEGYQKGLHTAVIKASSKTN